MFQNNHHRHPSNPNFASRWFELDPAYPSIVLGWLGIIHLERGPESTGPLLET